MDQQTERILTHDSLYESEKAFGNKHWSEFNELERGLSLLKFIDDNQKKKDHLESIGDTHWGIKWNDFLKLIKQYGFVEGLKYDWLAPKYNDNEDDRIEEAIIYYHPRKGLVLWATSYGNKDHINGGNLYGEIKANSKEDCNTIWKWLSTGGCINSNLMIYKTQQDVREGLFSKLEVLESAGVFQEKWIDKNRFLWFLDYSEEKKESYDYKQISKEKIMRCPKDLQEIIGVN
jgi:hypothetical protein